MATDATGTPSPLGIPKYNTAVDAPSGLGLNAIVDSLDTLITARVIKPASIATGETSVYNGTTFVRSSTTKLASGNFGPVVNTDVDAAAAIAVSKLAAGTNTHVLTTTGGVPVWSAPAVGGTLLALQNFTSTGTYTPTAGTTKVYIECVGGGGGSGGCSATTGDNSSGGSGGGGAYSAKFMTSAFSGKTVTIGGAGSAGASGNNAGGNGGDTTFDSTVIVAKGGAGGGGGGVGVGAAGGAGGLASGGTGDLKLDGAAGQSSTSAGASGSGGGSVFGPSQGGQNSAFPAGQKAARTGCLYGGGSSGPANNGSQSAQAGGAGAQGCVRIWEFSG